MISKKMENFKDSILVDEDEFKAFREDMNYFYTVLSHGESLHNIEKNEVERLRRIIYKLEQQRNFFMQNLENSEKIWKNLDVFYNDFLALFMAKVVLSLL